MTWKLLVLFMLSPIATAGTADSPELVDPADDVSVDILVNGYREAVPAPWASAVDMAKVWFTDDADGLHVTIEVGDMSALDAFTAGALPNVMWYVLWQPSYQDMSGAAGRIGEWMLRAEYRPLDSTPWHYWMERPCLDGNADDGCTGAERDIVDGLTGSVDRDGQRVSITAPWWELGAVQPGDGIYGLRYGGNVQWPASIASTASDWDYDQDENTCYAFQAVPTDSAAFTGFNDGATGSSNGYNGWPEPRPNVDACVAAGVGRGHVGPATNPQEAAETGGESPQSVESGSDDSAPNEDSPILGVGTIVLVIAGLASRRRQI